jgi:predicted kinase
MELILIRGIPGSGKSTLAQSLDFDVHFEADMYFINDAGEYCYDPSKIKDAHEWCQRMTHAALSKGQIVVVSNTFVTRSEMAPYFEMAEAFGIYPRIIEATGRWLNTHNVPESVIDAMLKKWEAL